jgi:hypothetical protein
VSPYFRFAQHHAQTLLNECPQWAPLLGSSLFRVNQKFVRQI